jgi:hypothetical protein
MHVHYNIYYHRLLIDLHYTGIDPTCSGRGVLIMVCGVTVERWVQIAERVS